MLDDLIKEVYLISKFTNTSYTDVDNITHIERHSLLKHITKDLENQNRIMRDAKNKGNN